MSGEQANAIVIPIDRDAVPASKTWRALLSVSTAHLTGDTLKIMEAWSPESAPVPGFARHTFGFYVDTWCHEGDDPVPADLATVLMWAARQGADTVRLDADGITHHGALADYSPTHARRHAPLLTDDEVEAIAKREAARRIEALGWLGHTLDGEG